MSQFSCYPKIALNTTLGQKTMAQSMSVVIASDQSAVPVTVGSLPLPTGAATAANQATEIASLASIDGKITACNTGAVVIASSALPSGAATAANQVTEIAGLASIDGKIVHIDTGAVVVSSSALPSGASTAANQATEIASLASIDGKITACNTGAVVIASSALPSGASTAALQTTGNTSLASIDGKTPALGQALAAASVPVVLTASQLSTLTPLSTIAATQSGTWTVQPGNTANTTAWLVKEETSSTSTLSNVSSSASSVSILASNASRKNATFFNESTSILYLKLGTTASLTSYTVQIPANSYYELPVGKIYTGAIDGIWASANGTLRVTELS